MPLYNNIMRNKIISMNIFLENIYIKRKLLFIQPSDFYVIKIINETITNETCDLVTFYTSLHSL